MQNCRFAPVGRTFPLLYALISFAASSQALDGPLTPEEALKVFQHDPNIQVELVAAEPLVVDPVAIAFDERGRIYVAEDRGYPVGPGKGQPPAGKIALLEDTNRDGIYDKRTTFAENLTFPNGVMCWKGGVFVTCAPDLFYFKDTDGDGKADIKRVVFKGFQDLSTTQLRESHPILNIDNWIYMNCGLTAAKVVAPDCPNREPLLVDRKDFRFRPETCQYEEFSGTGQFGGTFDSLGRRFICSNRNHNQHVVMQARYLRRNPNYSFSEFVQDTPDHGAAARVYPLSHNITTAASHTGYFTSACGVTVYTGNSLPADYRGNSFTCEPAGNLVHRDVLVPHGPTFIARRAFPTNEFLASPDNWFRPVNLANGPDGALYVCDMYRKTIEHPEYLPEATRKITDFESGRDKGRIWRITAAYHPPPVRVIDLTKDTTRELCFRLENPEGWWRMTAHRLLLERKDPASIPLLASTVKAGRRTEARVQALYLLDAMGGLTSEVLDGALHDKRSPVREHAVVLAESRLAKDSKLAHGVISLAKDVDPRVRFQCALALGEIDDKKIVPALATIAVRDAEDKWMRAAVLSSLSRHGNEFLQEIASMAAKLAAAGKNAENSLLPLLTDLGKMLGTDTKQTPLALLQTMTQSDEPLDFAWQMALLSGFADGLRISHTNGSSRSVLMNVVASDSATAKRVDEFMQHAGKIAVDSDQPMARRLAAIGLLGQADFSVGGETLQKLIDPAQPSELQIASVRALGQVADAKAAAALVKREKWNGYTQAVKDAVLATILGDVRLMDALLAAIEKGDIPPTSVNPEKRNQLMKHKNEEISKRATALFKDLKPGDRMKVYEEYKEILSLKPNVQNGHSVFTRTCTPCHVFSGEGHALGPDLTGIRNQPADVLLLHIIVPEYEIMPIYTQYNVETKDGRSLSGILAAETPSSITLRQPLGIEEQIQRSNIASMSASQLSIMPQELEKTMTKQDLADLIGYLKSGN